MWVIFFAGFVIAAMLAPFYWFIRLLWWFIKPFARWLKPSAFPETLDENVKRVSGMTYYESVESYERLLRTGVKPFLEPHEGLHRNALWDIDGHWIGGDPSEARLGLYGFGAKEDRAAKRDRLLREERYRARHDEGLRKLIAEKRVVRITNSYGTAYWVPVGSPESDKTPSD